VCRCDNVLVGGAIEHLSICARQSGASPWSDLAETWEGRYPAIIRPWESSWAEFVPFLAFDVEIRRVICATNAIESVNARLRRAVRARGHFPTEAAALKCLYLAVMSLDPTGAGRKRWTNRWKKALNAFDMTFDGRVSAGREIDNQNNNQLHRNLTDPKRSRSSSG
jgi:putative transposase